MNYADYFSAADVAAYRRVKLGTMRVAGVARQVAAEIVDGTVTTGPGRKHYVVTRRGRYRLAMAANSDNAAERREHERLRARYVVMGDNDAMADWFCEHGAAPDEARGLVDLFHELVRRRLAPARAA